MLVVTRLIIENGSAMKDYFAPYANERLLALAESHWKAMKLATRKGVRMVLGTDIAGALFLVMRRT